MTEHQEQVALIQWFRLQHKKYAKCLFSIPNGAHLAGDARLRAIKMNNLKASGLVPGVSDLFLMIPKGGWHGLFIELKVKGGKVSESQKEFMGLATLMGYQAVVCYGFESAKLEITKYLQST
jgi:hypothetical protein